MASPDSEPAETRGERSSSASSAHSWIAQTMLRRDKSRRPRRSRDRSDSRTKDDADTEEPVSAADLPEEAVDPGTTGTSGGTIPEESEGADGDSDTNSDNILDKLLQHLDTRDSAKKDAKADSKDSPEEQPSKSDAAADASGDIAPASPAVETMPSSPAVLSEEEDENESVASGVNRRFKRFVKSLSSSSSRRNSTVRKTRFEKRKLKKEAKAAQNAPPTDAVLDAEAEDERKAIDAACEKYALTLHEVEPDGSCMYASLADQVNCRLQPQQPVTVTTMRKVAAEYMRSHKDDFIFFLAPEDESEAIANNDGILTDEQYEEYCNRVASTAEWGGEPEMLAISKHLNIPIYVIQSSTDILKLGESEEADQAEPLYIAYHRKMYGLGEHYNSLRPREQGKAGEAESDAKSDDAKSDDANGGDARGDDSQDDSSPVTPVDMEKSIPEEPRKEEAAEASDAPKAADVPDASKAADASDASGAPVASDAPQGEARPQTQVPG